jgi:hypothetical protein
LDAAGLGDTLALAHVLVSASGAVSWRSISPAAKRLIFLALIGFSTLSCGSKSQFWDRKIRAAFRRGFDTINLDRAGRQPNKIQVLAR